MRALLRKIAGVAVGWAVLTVLSPSAVACAVCFGRSDSEMAKAMNWGIFALLVVIAGVLASAAACFVCLARRAAAYAAANADAPESLNDVEIKSGAS
jgi:hypothetical protein